MAFFRNITEKTFLSYETVNETDTEKACLVSYEPHHEETCLLGYFPQGQSCCIILNLRFKQQIEVCSQKHYGYDQLHHFCASIFLISTTKLICTFKFLHTQITGFLTAWLKSYHIISYGPFHTRQAIKCCLFFHFVIINQSASRTLKLNGSSLFILRVGVFGVGVSARSSQRNIWYSLGPPRSTFTGRNFSCRNLEGKKVVLKFCPGY